MLDYRKIKLKTGESVHLELLTGGETAKEFMEFMNPIIEESPYLRLDMPQTIEQEEEWLAGMKRASLENTGLMAKALANGKLVGTAEAKRGEFKELENAELSIALEKDYRGRGLGRQLMGFLIDVAKKRWKTRNFYLFASKPNKRAIRFYEKMGFRKIAVLPKWQKTRGEYVDKVMMVLDGRKA